MVDNEVGCGDAVGAAVGWGVSVGSNVAVGARVALGANAGLAPSREDEGDGAIGRGAAKRKRANTNPPATAKGITAAKIATNTRLTLPPSTQHTQHSSKPRQFYHNLERDQARRLP